VYNRRIMQHDGPPDGYVTTADACKRLGISDRTLRRRVQAGTIEGEYVARPQGSVLYVKLPAEAATQAAHTTDAASASEGEQVASETAEAAAVTTEPPAATTGLLAIIEGDRETIRGQAYTIGEQAARIAELEREAGRLEGRLLAAERDALAERLARAEMQASQIVEERQRAAQHPWWERLFGRMRDAPQ
jgi:hypothetical protein